MSIPLHKVTHDERKGMITYLRIYSGTIKPADKVLNSTINETERPMKLYRVLADDMEVLSEV